MLAHGAHRDKIMPHPFQTTDCILCHLVRDLHCFTLSYYIISCQQGHYFSVASQNTWAVITCSCFVSSLISPISSVFSCLAFVVCSLLSPITCICFLSHAHSSCLVSLFPCCLFPVCFL